MHDYEYKLLSYLKDHKFVSLNELATNLNLNIDSIRWSLEDLKKNRYIEVHESTDLVYKVSDEGKRDIDEGFPEIKLIELLESKGGKLELKVLDNKLGLVWAKKNGWIDITDGYAILNDNGKNALNNTYPQFSLLKTILDGNSKTEKLNESILVDLLKRKLIETKKSMHIDNISITNLGLEQLKSQKKEQKINNLTKEILLTKAWKDKKFEEYDINLKVPENYPALRHPMNEFLNFIRYKMLSMGFSETYGSIVESSFWVFDSLFSPQDHPTRDMQDTFFLSNPNKLDIDDKKLFESVKKMHLRNWKGTWKESIAEQPVLRTHTTSVSAHSIYSCRDSDFSNPIKLFTIDKAFRNESIDYKHLAELYQLDGIIIGKDLNMANLIKVLKDLYGSMNLDIKIQPSYFPFVEPGLEIQYFDKSHNDWIEMGGGGIIRKEITTAMGLNGATVLAWGLGLDRMLLSKANLDNLSDLYKNNIGWLKSRTDLNLE